MRDSERDLLATVLWSYLAAAGKVAGTPFGANPHALVI